MRCLLKESFVIVLKTFFFNLHITKNVFVHSCFCCISLSSCLNKTVTFSPAACWHISRHTVWNPSYLILFSLHIRTNKKHRIVCLFGTVDCDLKCADVSKSLKWKLVIMRESDFLACCVLQLKGFILAECTLMWQISINRSTLGKMKW